jgi:2,3-bisphosphoglycerate-independent phosphoglycerate mutase
MDLIARRGCVGRVQTVPFGLPPGSDVANMSLMGYDAAKYYQGRAPIEAASMGVALQKNETAFRCNLVTLEDGKMLDYSAGHIATDIARDLVSALQKELGNSRIRFYPGVSYRHLLVIADFPSGKLDCTPPHDISGKLWAGYVPQGAGSDELLELMAQARGILAAAPANQRLASTGKPAATDIWLWGQGTSIAFPSMRERFGISGSVISAVDLVQGLGVLAGLTVKKVAGATGYLGTNYAGKVAAAREALKGRILFLSMSRRPMKPRTKATCTRKYRQLRNSTGISSGKCSSSAKKNSKPCASWCFPITRRRFPRKRTTGPRFRLPFAAPA